MAHTPGPWVISDRDHECNDHRIVVRGPGGSLIATVGNMAATSDHKPTAKRWKTESPANARLIAAAPDLLAALEHACDKIDKHAPGLDYLAVEWLALIARARASPLSTCEVLDEEGKA